MQALGSKIRRQRRQLGLTLEDVAVRARISKPYLSIIETGRVGNPPSDEKLRAIERALGFSPGELVAEAHLQRTPSDVRAVLKELMSRDPQCAGECVVATNAPIAVARIGTSASGGAADETPAKQMSQNGVNATMKKGAGVRDLRQCVAAQVQRAAPGAMSELDNQLRGMLRAIYEQSAGLRPIGATPVRAPLAISASAPSQTRSPSGASNDSSIDALLGLAAPIPLDAIESVENSDAQRNHPYVGCPDVSDPQAFAARVGGDSMLPKYRARDIVIFSPGELARDGDDCLVRFDDGRASFRRVFFEVSKKCGPVLRLQPRNERFKARTVETGRVAGIYRAVFRYQRVDVE